jgi:hypothetical protein
MKQTYERDNPAADQIVHAPGISGAVYSYERLMETMLRNESPEYVETCWSCCDLLEAVNPTLVVVDMVLNQAVDACRLLKGITWFLQRARSRRWLALYSRKWLCFGNFRRVVINRALLILTIPETL